MNHYDEVIDFSDSDSSEPLIDSGAGRFRDEYLAFEFEAMALVPYALTAFIDHQKSFEL
jgi:hypothetical protein